MRLPPGEHTVHVYYGEWHRISSWTECTRTCVGLRPDLTGCFSLLGLDVNLRMSGYMHTLRQVGYAMPLSIVHVDSVFAWGQTHGLRAANETPRMETYVPVWNNTFV